MKPLGTGDINLATVTRTMLCRKSRRPCKYSSSSHTFSFQFFVIGNLSTLPSEAPPLSPGLVTMIFLSPRKSRCMGTNSTHLPLLAYLWCSRKYYAQSLCSASGQSIFNTRRTIKTGSIQYSSRSSLPLIPQCVLAM